MRSPMRLLILICPMLLFVTSCGEGSDQRAAEPSVVETNPYGGVDVPPPAPDERILKVARGELVLEFSLNDLRKLQLVEETVFEPFVKRTMTFVGVPMSVLFDAAGIKGSDEVFTIALNEYTYSNLAEEFVGTDAFVAFEQNGALIPMSEGGPIRIIIPNGRRLSDNLDIWNWSLAEIRVE